MPPERRRSPRIAEQLPLALTAPEGPLEAKTKNLSASGTYCALNRFIAPMTKLALQLNLPQSRRHRTIRCSGVVVRVEAMPRRSSQSPSYDTAIFFTNIAERDRTAINRFIHRRLSAPLATPRPSPPSRGGVPLAGGGPPLAAPRPSPPSRGGVSSPTRTARP